MDWLSILPSDRLTVRLAGAAMVILLHGPASASNSAAAPLPSPGGVGQTAALAPPEAGADRVRRMIIDAWQDATATWTKVLGASVYDSDPPQINFVSEVRASHCYGLYVSAGPVYCSGNNTIFVSVGELQKIEAKVAAVGDGGLVFLVAHELGHHIQKITGRFRVLSALAREAPQLQRELAVRFELEADCLAGVWAGQSAVFAASADIRRQIRLALDAIGDDRMQIVQAGVTNPATYTHGTSEQRAHWFNVGLDGGRPDACSVLEAAVY